MYKEIVKDGLSIHEGITLELRFEAEEDDISFNTILSENDEIAAQAVQKPQDAFEVISSFFKILEKVDTEWIPKTSFTPPLKMIYCFTHGSWFKNDEKDYWKKYGRPMVYYLEKTVSGWGSQWMEFPDTWITFVPAVKSDPDLTAILTITTSTLPDPRVGGC